VDQQRGRNESLVLNTEGTSMVPFVLPDSELVVAAVVFDNVEVGDIVCYPGEEKKVVAHRVMEVQNMGNDRRFAVRGDSNRDIEWLSDSAIAYVVETVRHPFLSYNTASKVGRLLSCLAIRDGFSFRWMKKLLFFYWRVMNGLFSSGTHTHNVFKGHNSLWGVAAASVYMAVAVVGVVLCMQTTGVFSFPVFADDAFYYLGIGRSIAMGNGFTVDGLHSTTGFHPLWAFILSLVAKITAFNKIWLLCTTIVLQGMLAAAGWLTLWSVIARTNNGPRILGPLLFVVATLPDTMLALMCGVESALAFFLIALHLKALLYAIETNQGWWKAGLLLALAVFARLDFVVLGLGEACVLLIERRHRIPRIIGAIVVPVICAFALWAFACLLIDGSLVPIHVFLKTRQFPSLKQTGFPIWYLPQLAWVAPVGLMFGILRVRTFFKEKSLGRSVDLVCLSVLVAAGLQVVSIVLFQRCWIGPWYGVLVITGSFFLSDVVIRFVSQAKRKALSTGVSLTLFLALATMWGRQAYWNHDSLFNKYEQDVSIMAAADWLNEHLKEGERIGAMDSGRLSYFSNFPVINLDGLVNDYEYQHVLKTAGLTRYLAREKVRYFVLVWPGELKRPDRLALSQGKYESIAIKPYEFRVFSDFDYVREPLVLKSGAEVMRRNVKMPRWYDKYLLLSGVDSNEWYSIYVWDLKLQRELEGAVGIDSGQ
jgi:hypothetical protein